MNFTINCQKCRKVISDIKDICFYKQADQSVHLILKHEFKAKYIDKSINVYESEPNKKNIKKIKCAYCKEGNTIASECPFGPQKTPFIGFMSEKVILKNKIFTKKDKWNAVISQFPDIEIRNDETFFGDSIQINQQDEQINNNLNEYNQFSLPNPQNKSDFEWRQLLIKKQPRKYQIEAFIEVLLNDIIVVIPTGQGKTLIASMFLKKMKQINKSHLGLLIAEKIPLVHQQGNSIQTDTGLRVCCITGESRNVKKLKRLKNGAYDTLVITAGALLDMINKKELTFNMFSAIVFDECHHAQGDHLYCKLLYFLKQLNKKPRILGLTASPFKAKGYDYADKELNKIQNMFQGARLFIPSNDLSQNQTLNWIIANLTSSQIQYQEQIFDLFQNKEKIQKQLDPQYEIEKKLRMDKIYYPRIMGKLNDFSESYSVVTQQRQKENIEYLKLLLDSIILQEIMGVKYGIPAVNESIMTKNPIIVKNPDEISNRLKEVKNILQKCNNQERILIFVDTRLVANILTELLQKEFPHLNPLKIVGHGGFDGMRWEQEQNIVVGQFRTGESRLLVSTSVLEEGIDVPECDIVIRYTGIKSLIQFIQSRGRARKQQSKFIVICNQKEKELAENILFQEQIMKLKLDEYSQQYPIPSKLAIKIMRELQIDEIDFDLQKKQEVQCIYEDNKNSISFELFIENRFQENQNIYKMLLISFSQMDHIKLKRLEIFDQNQNNLNRKFSKIFNPNEIQALCSIQINNSKNNEILDFLEFFKQWEFSVNNFNVMVHFLQSSLNDYKFNNKVKEQKIPKQSNIKPSKEQCKHQFDNINKLNQKYLDNINNELKDSLSNQSKKNQLKDLFKIQFQQILNKDNDKKQKIKNKDIIKEQDCLIIDQLSLGNFINREKFLNLNELGDFQLETQGKQRFLLFTSDLGLVDNLFYVKLCIRLTFQSISEFGIFSLDDRSQNINIFLPLQKAPYIYFRVSQNANLKKDEDYNEYDEFNDEYLLDDYGEYQNKVCNDYRVSRNQLAEEFQLQRVIRLSINLDTEGTIFQKINTMFSQTEVFPFPIFYSKIKIITNQNLNFEIQKLDLFDLESIQYQYSRQAQWNLMILQSKNWFHYDIISLQYISDQIYKMYQLKDINLIQLQSLAISLVKPKYYWSNIQLIFDQSINSLQNIYKRIIEQQQSKIQENYILMKRIVITPLKIYFQDSIPIQKSRLIRMYGDKYEFIQVAFRDENFQKLRGKIIVQNTIEDQMINGINILGRTYRFFCASASQTRDHKAYFMLAETQKTIDLLRKQIILDQHKFDSTAKYLSRLGLFCSGDQQAIKIPIKSYEMIPDIRANDGNLLTDGSGIIPLELLNQIKQIDRLRLEQNVSAIQIRYAGFKGVLVASPAQKNPGKKFENDDQMLCIVRGANYIPLTLNRQVLTLMSSIDQGQWNFEDYIFDVQEKFIQNSLDAFTDKLAALQYLNKYIQHQYLDDVYKNVEFLKEPFWLELIKLDYCLKIKYLAEKSKIPLDKACMLMGVPDPLSILNENEVFLQIQKPDESEITVIIGDVIIYRNPCMHPGDIRIVKAVDNIQLHQWTNVLIFPVKNCLRSVTADCSGGDLDGDIFSIIWDEKLIPPKEVMIDPFDYSSLCTNIPQDANPLLIENIADFYIKCICNDCLGRVSNMHLAISDIQEEGACDDLAINLSIASSQAVDFPKTGIVPEILDEIQFVLREKGYPDFMEQSQKKQYISEKIIGKLYRRCQQSIIEFDEFDSQIYSQYKFDKNIQLQGYEVYLRESLDIYQSYSYHMQRIMSYFDLSNESEIILSTALKWHYTLQGDKDKASQNIKDYYQNIKNIYRDIFFIDKLNEEETLKKASAWYVAAYTQEMKEENQKIFLSFPWIVGDLICRIYEKQKQNKQEPSLQSMEVSLSVLNFFKKQVKILQKKLQEKDQLMKKVSLCVQDYIQQLNKEQNKNYQFDIQPYGSSSFFVNRDDSDLDICVIPPQQLYNELKLKGIIDLKQQNRYILENIISIALNHFVEIKSENYQTENPCIQCSVCIEKDDNFDISLNKDGLHKTQIIMKLFEHNSLILPYFQFMVEWARCIGLIKQNENDQGQIPSAHFYLLLVDQFKEQIYDNNIVPFGKTLCETFDILTNKISNEYSNDQIIFLEEQITFFFTKYSKIKGEINLIWPLINQKIKYDLIITSQIASKSIKSLLVLKASKKIDQVLKYFLNQTQEEQTITKVLPLFISLQIKPFDYHQARFHKLSGAQIFLQKNSKNKLVTLIGKGSKSQIYNLKKEIFNVINSQKKFLNGKLMRNTSIQFVDNCTLYQVKNSTEDSRIKFVQQPLFPSQFWHKMQSKYQIILNHIIKIDWQEEFVQRLTNKMYEQLSIYFQTKNSSHHGKLDITVRFGAQYFLQIEKKIPSTQLSFSIDELQQYIERSYQNKRKKLLNEWEYNEIYQGEEEDKQYIKNKQKMEQIQFQNYEIEQQEVNQFQNKKKKIQNIKNKKKNEKKQYIKSAFSPCLLLDNFQSDFDIQTCQSIYRKVLKENQFELQNNYQQKYYMKVKLQMSKSIEVEILLNEKLEVLNYYISPLKWVNCIIFDGKQSKLEEQNKILENHDVRITVRSQNLINEQSDLYKAIFKNQNLQPPIYLQDNKPKVRKQNFLNQNYSVFHVRHIKKMEHFTLGESEANILLGKEYYGTQLESEKNIAEMYLKFDCSHITEDNYSYNLIKELANKIFKTSIKVSDEINNQIKNMN